MGGVEVDSAVEDDASLGAKRVGEIVEASLPVSFPSARVEREGDAVMFWVGVDAGVAFCEEDHGGESLRGEFVCC